jgi:hypothetical protein
MTSFEQPMLDMPPTALPMGIEPRESLLAHRQFCMAFAAHQDVLLQMYRIQLLGFEFSCALIIAGIGWMPFEVPGFQLVILLMALWAHARVGNTLHAAIGYRALDVDHTHKQLLIAEAHIPVSMRGFTRFKIYQDRDPESLARKESIFLSAEQTATEVDVAKYFFEHKSKSRGVLEKVLCLPAKLTLVLGLMAILQAVLALSTV